MRQFIVVAPLQLGYGSNTRRHTPNRFKTHKAGTLLRLHCEAPNGNVWFYDPDDERGLIECGEVANLTRAGRIVEV